MIITEMSVTSDTAIFCGPSEVKFIFKCVAMC